MYLSRVELDTTNRNTLKAFSNRNCFHAAIAYCFQGEKALWRLDCVNNKYYLLLVSRSKSDLTHIQKQFGNSKTVSESLDYTSLLDRINEGQNWHFRLAANPVKSLKSTENPKERGKVHGHVTVNCQQEWLKSRAQKHGFSVSDDNFKVIANEWITFNKRESKNKIVLLSVVFEGKLTITDSVLLKKALQEGIGKGKAYGLGMLTIAKPKI
ncbi:MAG: type I-E CRISPR-associated protein Cas6/Cse3/CasE [Candidatus Riflebacteria bacterium]|nr:type I-E CRISPR-associated protein Cas6/Cse3/CasE [Candidatus Riflebacteria bacterium]